jgi:aryl-alcohol dehydrogenase-like predicted oxidoreductase
MHYFDPATPLEETLGTLDMLVKQGKIRYIGCSNYAAWQLCKALWVSDKHGLERFQSVQPEYNLRKRNIEAELFPLCADQNVGIIPYQILMGGVLTGRYDRNSEPPGDSHMASRHAARARNTYWTDANFDMVEKLRAIAGELGCDLPQLIVAWTLAKPVITSVIVGASRPEQVVSNAKATEISLPDDLVKQMDAL